MSAYFQLNEPDASAEVFATEVLAINLVSGHYHSLTAGAVPLWRLLIEERFSLEQAITTLADSLQGDQETVRAEVQHLVSGLVAKAVIVATESTETAAVTPAWLAELKPPYVSPVFETYTDMKDLLLVDPIHEVDVTGWPHQPADGANESK